MVHVRVSLSLHARSRKALGLVGMALLGLLAVALLAPGANAGGTGVQVTTDPTGGESVATDPGARDWIRLGATSDATYLHVWLKTVAASTPPNPTVVVDYEVGFCVNNVAYFISPLWNAGGSWTPKNVYNSGACAAQAGGAGPNALPTPSWACNELHIRIPRAALAQPPSDGATMSNYYAVTWSGGTPGTTYDSGTGGTYVIGQQGQMWQNAPTVTAAPNGDNQIRVSWTQTDNGAQPASVYKVYRSVNGALPYTLVYTSPGAATSFYDDVGLTTGTTYSYKVSNVNCADLSAQSSPPAGEPAYTGGESLRSAAVTVTPDFRPASPTSLAVGSATTSTLGLSWTAATHDCPLAACTPAGTGATGVQGYKIYRGAAGAETFFADVPASTACSGSSCTYTNTGLTASTNYCYYLRTYDGYAGAGGPNLSPQPTPIAPPAEACGTTTSGVTPTPPSCTASPASVAIGVATTFTASGGTPTYSWSAPGGSPSSGSGNPFSVAYGTSGIKTVDVSGGGSGSCTVTVTAANQPPTVTCSITSPAPPFSPSAAITFSSAGTSDPEGNNPLTYAWAFPSGSITTSTLASPPAVTWSAVGTYAVTLTVTDSLGAASAPASCGITIGGPTDQPPVAGPKTYTITVGTGLFQTSASPFGGLSNVASDPEGAPLTYTTCTNTIGASLTPGTGHFSIVAPATPQTLSFTYRVQDAASASGCATVTLQFVQNFPPTAHFTMQPNPATVGELVAFTDMSSDPDAGDALTQWRWTFNDGASSSSRNPAHSFGAARSYTVCLVVTDSRSASSPAKCQSLQVGGPAAPGPAPPPAEAPQEMPPGEVDDDGPGEKLAVGAGPAIRVAPGDVVTASVTSDGSPATTYTWTQTSGAPVQLQASGRMLTFTAPAEPAALSFRVDAKDGSRTGSGDLFVTVAPEAVPPTVVVDGPRSGAAGATVTLDGSATSGAGTLRYTWLQVDGPASRIQRPQDAVTTVVLGDAGAAAFLLVVTGDGGTASAPHAIDVASAGPADGAGFTLRVDGATVTVVPDVTAPSYRWDFGDGSQAVVTDGVASHTYPDGVNDYTITLVAGGETYSGTAQVAVAEDGADSEVGASRTAAEPVTIPVWLPYALAGFVVTFLAVAAFIVVRRRASLRAQQEPAQPHHGDAL